MKIRITMILMAMSLIACQKKQYYTSSPEIDLVKKGNEAYIKGDWTALRSLYADTAKVVINTWLDQAMTADKFIETEKAGTAGLSEYKMENTIMEMVVDDSGSHWVHTWFLHIAKFKNGKEAKVPVHFTTRVENGMVVFQGFIFDSLPGFLAAQDSTAGK